jgi:hypothetical protein
MLHLAKKACEKSMTNVPLPVIYMFSLRQIITPPNTLYEKKHVLVKYGLTKHLYRRAAEHCKTFGPDISLSCHAYIDPLYLVAAENDIKQILVDKGWHLGHHFETDNNDFTIRIRSNELALIPATEMKFVKEQYRLVGEYYQHINILKNRVK